MRTFNLELAKAGEPVVTSNGKPVRIICFDHLTKEHGGPIIGLVLGKSKVHEMIVQYNLDGIQVDNVFSLNLMMKNEYEIKEESESKTTKLTKNSKKSKNVTNKINGKN